MPVAWKVLKADEKRPWKTEWLALLKRFKGILPSGWMVIAPADRGLYAKWLFEAIVQLKWHPSLRVNAQGSFRPEGGFRRQPFSCFVPAKGARWQGRGTAFSGKKTQLRCTLLGCWGENYKDPWLVLTDLAPECTDSCRYGLRAWIEQGFKHSKRSGWQWQHTRMDDPERAERLWMAIAIATWWLLSVGGEAESQADTQLDIPVPSAQGTATRKNLAENRHLSTRLVFRLWLLCLTGSFSRLNRGDRKHGPAFRESAMQVVRWEAMDEKTHPCNGLGWGRGGRHR